MARKKKLTRLQATWLAVFEGYAAHRCAQKQERHSRHRGPKLNRHGVPLSCPRCRSETAREWELTFDLILSSADAAHRVGDRLGWNRPAIRIGYLEVGRSCLRSLQGRMRDKIGASELLKELNIPVLPPK